MPDIFGSQREEELTMIEQQINPALDNNAHVSNNIHDDVTTCVCVYLGCNVLSAGDGSEQNEECS